jgi:hypothetical protein
MVQMHDELKHVFLELKSRFQSLLKAALSCGIYHGRKQDSVNRQPSIVNRQPSIVNRQPSTIHRPRFNRFSPRFV